MALAEDLVKAAAETIYGAAYGAATKRKAQRVTVAVVRRVVRQLRFDGETGTDEWRSAYAQAANDLEFVADQIERGGQS